MGRKIKLVADERVNELARIIENSLSPDAATSCRAKETLQSESRFDDFAMGLLSLVDSSESIDVRREASIHLANLLRLRLPAAGFSPSDSHLPTFEREIIKSRIFDLVISSPVDIQDHVAAALAAAAASDFPCKWERSILPSIASFLQTALDGEDFAAANSYLNAAAAFLSRFRGASHSDALQELSFCVDNFAPPFLHVFIDLLRCCGKVMAMEDPAKLLWVLRCIRLCCEISYSLCSLDLPKHFKDNKAKLMENFSTILAYTYPESSESETNAALDAVQACVYDNLILHTKKYIFELNPYLVGFLDGVRKLNIWLPSSRSSYNQLLTTAVRFMTEVVKSAPVLFNDEHTLKWLFSFLAPKLCLSDEDVQLFHNQWMEYVRQDLAIDHASTLRGRVIHLLLSLGSTHSQQVDGFVDGQIQAASSSNDQSIIEAAIFLYLAKPVGDPNTFWMSLVFPVFQRPGILSEPMLCATAVRFLGLHMRNIDKTEALKLLPDLARLLSTSSSSVVHSYAAIAIQNLFVPEDVIQGSRQPRYAADEIDGIVPHLFHGLRTSLHSCGENVYAMKCMMHVIGFANMDDEVIQMSVDCLLFYLNNLNGLKNDEFNCHLFGAVWVLIQHAEKNATLLPQFEAVFFGPLEEILLRKELSDLWQFAFKIFEQFVRLRIPHPLDKHTTLFDHLLDSACWERQLNLPSCVSLLKAFLPEVEKDQSRLDRVLKKCGKLVKQVRTQDSGFEMLCAVVLHVRFNLLEPYMFDIWQHLLDRIEGIEHLDSFISSLIFMISLFLYKHGVDNLAATMIGLPAALAISADMRNSAINSRHLRFKKFIEHFWIPKLYLFDKGGIKVSTIGSILLLTRIDLLKMDLDLWGRLLGAMFWQCGRSLAYTGDCEEMQHINAEQFLISYLPIICSQCYPHLRTLVNRHVLEHCRKPFLKLCSDNNINVF